MINLEREFLLSKCDSSQTFSKEILLNLGYKLYLGENTICHYKLDDNKIIIFIGIFFDSMRPKLNSEELVSEMFKNIANIEDFIEIVYPFGGRWIAITQFEEKYYVVPDTLTSYETYYSIFNHNLFVSSSSSILADHLGKEKISSEEFNEFINSYEFKLYENFMVGNQSVFNDIYKLLPNSYINDTDGKKRFWVDNEVNKKNKVDEVASEVALLLENSIEALLNMDRKVMLPITAGWDSRVLLAASSNYTRNISYYVSTHNRMNQDDADIFIPTSISNDFKLELKIVDNLPNLSEEVFNNIKLIEPLARNLSKSQIIQYHYDNNKGSININGNGNEIVRLDAYDAVANPKTTKSFLYLYSEYGHFSYPMKVIESWRKELKENYPTNKLTERDFFYWEQRLGNWGSLYPKELEIAVNEISPYNNRKIILLLASLDDKYRRYPDYIVYRKIIKKTWPELLDYQFNHTNVFDILKMKISRRIDSELKYKIRKKTGKR